MRHFAVYITLAFCAVNACNGEFKMETIRECTQKLNITPDGLKKAMTGEIRPADVNPNTKCAFLCISEKEGMAKDGIFQTQMMAEILLNSTDKDAAVKVTALCKDLKGANTCDTAYKITACVQQGKRV